MTRWKASIIHLILSVLVLCIIATVLVWRWYPPGLFHMANADKLLLIIAGVDVVMGPLLTLIIYQHGKKSLKFDLTVIALLQLGAMGYGLHTIWQSRPVYMVALVDRFHLVFANELDSADLRAAPERFRTMPWLTVETIAALVPKTRKEQQDLLFLTLDTGKDLHQMPKYYAPFVATAHELLGHAIPVDQFASRLSGPGAATFNVAVEDTGLDRRRIRIVPISSSRGDATMLLNAGNGQPLKPVAIDPWPVLATLQARQAKTDP